MKFVTTLFVMLAFAQVFFGVALFMSPPTTSIIPELLLNLLSSRSSSVPPSTLILREEDTTAAGSTEQFLSSRLCFTHDVHGQEICTVNSGDEEVGVMMGWEDDISGLLLLLLYECSQRLI